MIACVGPQPRTPSMRCPRSLAAALRSQPAVFLYPNIEQCLSLSLFSPTPIAKNNPNENTKDPDRTFFTAEISHLSGADVSSWDCGLGRHFLRGPQRKRQQCGDPDGAV